MRPSPRATRRAGSASSTSARRGPRGRVFPSRTRAGSCAATFPGSSRRPWPRPSRTRSRSATPSPRSPSSRFPRASIASSRSATSPASPISSARPNAPGSPVSTRSSSNMISSDLLAQAIDSGRRLEPAETLWCLREAPILALAELASAARQRQVPGDRVTFVIDANPNYTNVCDTYCTFCSFFREAGDADAYTHGVDALLEKARAARAKGATRLLLQGGHNPGLGFDYYLDLIRALREGVPELELHLFSPPEIRAIAGYTKLGVRALLERFFEAGLRTLPGGGAEILSARVRRRISPRKGAPEEWIHVMRTAHEVGFRTTATMMYGHVETDLDV